MSGYGYYGFRPYVPVAKRRANAQKHAARLAKKERRELEPVRIEGRKITRTFWGNAWCENLESYSDFANRLPRGRTYVRNGSVIDLQIHSGRVAAIVSGSEIYTVTIEIARLSKGDWTKIKADCAASIDSLMDLLAGRFSDGVMSRLTRAGDGLFPRPQEIKMACSCPDWAVLCKHVAAVLYGVGAHLDHRPELLFLLREVDHNELVTEAVAEGNLESALAGPENGLAGEDLGAMFGIELESAAASPTPARKDRRQKATSVFTGKKRSKAGKTPARAAGKGPTKKSATKTKTSGTRQTAAQENATPRRKPAKKKSSAGKIGPASRRRSSPNSASKGTAGNSDRPAARRTPASKSKKRTSRRLTTG